MLLAILLIVDNHDEREKKSKARTDVGQWQLTGGTPISPNFQKISRILKGSYLSEFQNEGGSNTSEFLDFYVKNAHLC